MIVKKDDLLVNKLKKDIEELEVGIKNIKLYNLKKINKRNFKIVGSIANFLIPAYIAATISVGGIKLLGGGLPFYTDSVNIDAKVKKYMNSEGDYIVSTSFEDFNEENYLKISEGWHENEDGLFEKSERTYYFTEMGEDELNQFINGQVDISEMEYSNLDRKTEVKGELPSDAKLSDNKTFIEACIYGVDKTNQAIRNESLTRNLLLSMLDIGVAAFLGMIGCHIRKYKIRDRINQIKNECKTISEDDIDLIKKKILIKKRNIETLTK